MPIDSVAQLTIQKLIEKFEKDIVYDCHNLHTRIMRSEAAGTLVGIGQKALRPIIEHLQSSCKSETTELSVGWCALLSHVIFKIDENSKSPRTFKDTKGWVELAEKFADKN